MYEEVNDILQEYPQVGDEVLSEPLHTDYFSNWEDKKSNQHPEYHLKGDNMILTPEGEKLLSQLYLDALAKGTIELVNRFGRSFKATIKSIGEKTTVATIFNKLDSYISCNEVTNLLTTEGISLPIKDCVGKNLQPRLDIYCENSLRNRDKDQSYIHAGLLFGLKTEVDNTLFLNTIGFDYSSGIKNFPSTIDSWDIDNLRQFIRAYLSTDGTISFTDKFIVLNDSRTKLIKLLNKLDIEVYKVDGQLRIFDSIGFGYNVGVIFDDQAKDLEDIIVNTAPTLMNVVPEKYVQNVYQIIPNSNQLESIQFDAIVSGIIVPLL